MIFEARLLEEETPERLSREITKASGVFFIGSIIGRVVTFGLHILLTRLLGAAGYGLYVLGMSVLSVTLSTTSLGLQTGVVRFCATYREEGKAA